ncbi:MAG: X2-like carbohydrate binding domain-containing protein [Desulfobacteraceae bacterium]|jgi:hypothetical protein
MARKISTIVLIILLCVGCENPGDATISPTSATFDKHVANQADIVVTMTLKENTLDAISDGSGNLVLGSDYSVSGSTVTIVKSYLANQVVSTLELTFDFSSGNDPVLTVTIIDTTQAEENHTLTIEVSGNGTTDPEAGTHTYAAGTRVSVTATPASGATFTGWGGAATGTANPVMVTMDADKTLAASFTDDGPDPEPEPDPDPENCNREVTSCTSPLVTVTDIDVGTPVMGYGQESDTDPLPMAIAAIPSGGSRLAWLGTDNRVYVATLDCNDQLVGTPKSFAGINLQDLYADENGGVVLLTRNATNGGTDNCGNGTLCGGTSSQCKTMHMVRFDDSGNVQWQQQVTNLSDTLAGYDNGARFVWWYQHHGRLAADDNGNYAAYFGIGITVNNGSCVDIHQGDRMQVVDSNGSLVSSHPDSFEVGCSHSWTTRMVWDPRTNRFVMVCATDNNCRIAQPSPYRTVAEGECDGTLFGGDLVLSSTPGYWTAWSQGGQVYLEHFTDGASDTTIITGVGSSHPHLVSYGATRMLLAWESGQSMAAQLYDSGTGESVGEAFTIDARDHNYQAFKAYPDGSVAYPAAGDNSTSIKIARVMPCSD